MSTCSVSAAPCPSSRSPTPGSPAICPATFFVAGRNAADARPCSSAAPYSTTPRCPGTAVKDLAALTYLEERRLIVSATGRFENLNDATLAVPEVPFVADRRRDGMVRHR
jgi:hypothetical protein